MEVVDIDTIKDLDEYFDYDIILQRMLDRVPTQIDKREGSIIYDALAPAAIELAQMYFIISHNMDLLFADTAVDEYLDRVCNNIGINRKEAVKAIRKAEFFDSNSQKIDVGIGERFTCLDVTFVVIERISEGVFKVECEVAGEKGNIVTGNMIAVNYIEGLAIARIGDVIIAGEDQESDENLRERYKEHVSTNPFRR